jgi:hypothetical protein
MVGMDLWYGNDLASFRTIYASADDSERLLSDWQPLLGLLSCCLLDLHQMGPPFRVWMLVGLSSSVRAEK